MSRSVIHKPAKIEDHLEQRLLKGGMIVFDTSAVGQMYHLTADSRAAFIEILGFLNKRIWFPDRVIKEYERHSAEFRMQPIKEKYVKPKFLSSGYLSDLKSFVDSLSEDPIFHPVYPVEYIEEMRSLSKEAERLLAKIRIKTEEAVKKRHIDVQSELNAEDPLLKAILDLPHGERISSNEVSAIIAEGDIRYRHRIPPGYMDEADKVSLDRFGDLFIWKEILTKAKRDGKDVIFVCNDVKEDWYASNVDGEETPREELIEEFTASTGGCHIWFYPIHRFLDKLQTLYPHDPHRLPLWSGLQAIAEEMRDIYQRQINKKKEQIVLNCHCCGSIIEFDRNDFFWEWHLDSSSYERHYGLNNIFVSKESVICPDCEESHDLKFIIEKGEIAIETSSMCSVESAFDFSETLDKNNVLQPCQKCGGWFTHLSDSGLCGKCEEFYATGMW